MSIPRRNEMILSQNNTQAPREQIINYYRHLNIPGGDLRISVTAQCNMKCTYCHNEGQGDFKKEFMSLETLRFITKIGLNYGVNKVRLTGGEPLIHPQIAAMVGMLKSELLVKNVGVNTNGLLLTPQKVQKLIDAKLDIVVVGLDNYDSKVSKDSPIGKSSEKILKQVLIAKEMGLNVQIAAVYNNLAQLNMIQLAEWCNNHNILLKILEVSDDKIAQSTSAEFVELVEVLKRVFGLSMGKTVAFNETYGIHKSGNKILFFHSHCRTRECHECGLMHMRITTNGHAMPCILRKDAEFNLVSENADHAMRRAIHNLGIPPERPIK